MNAILSYVLIAIIATAGLCLGILAFIDKGGPRAAHTTNERARTISVTGSAERFVQPDAASLSFSVTQKSPTISIASDSVNTRIASLLGFLREFGIEDADMKTLRYSVNPEYRYEDESRNRKLDGYRVNQSVQIKIRNIENVEAVLSRVGQTEIDNLSGPNFFVDDDEAIRAQLRQEAIADAKTKAAQLGKDLDVRLRTIVGFNEGGIPVSYDYPIARSFGLADSEQSVAEIPAGEDMLSASVTLEFEIE